MAVGILSLSIFTRSKHRLWCTCVLTRDLSPSLGPPILDKRVHLWHALEFQLANYRPGLTDFGARRPPIRWMLDNQPAYAFLAFYFAPAICVRKPTCSETLPRLRILQEYGTMVGVSHVTGSILEVCIHLIKKW